MHTPHSSRLTQKLFTAATLKFWAYGLALAFVAALVLQNRDPVQTRVLLVTLEMPLIVLLGLTGLLGFVLGLLAPALWRSRRVWPRRESAGRTSEPDPLHAGR